MADLIEVFNVDPVDLIGLVGKVLSKTPQLLLGQKQNLSAWHGLLQALWICRRDFVTRDIPNEIGLKVKNIWIKNMGEAGNLNVL